MSHVVFNSVGKQYENGFEAVKDLNLEIEQGEFLVMVGPSGCGKSTTLRMIAGLEGITSGTISIGDRVVNDLPPKDRDIAMVFQNYALYPHMTVYDNIAFALKLQKLPKAEIKERVTNAAQVLELTELLDRKPAKLSGGQRQRVAMGRAIVRRPQLFLLDEPLSNLDAKLRVQMRSEITELQREVGVTTFYVTHDQIEAMTMADRVAVINRGVLQQVAPPQQLFDAPENLFVAAFIGSPSMNLMEATIQPDSVGEELSLVLGSHRLTLTAELLQQRPALRNYFDRTVVLGIRPKDFEDSSVMPKGGQTITANITNTEALGYEVIAYFSIDAKQVVSEDALDLDDDAMVAPVSNDGTTMVAARFDPRTSARVGDQIQVVVDIDNAHFFDLDTGQAIRD
ncbi:MAG: multiple sugar transport system ATP-binding protein [Acidimicrobiales bacterium]|jgi:multiple sugar transport system ATP-binding protein